MDYDEEITKLMALPVLERCRSMKEYAARLGITKTELERVVRAEEKKQKAEQADHPEGEDDGFDGKRLSNGSDVEIANRVVNDLLEAGLYTHSEAAFYQWAERSPESSPLSRAKRGLWQEIEHVVIGQEFVEPYDGARYGKGASVKLAFDKIYKSILRLVAQKLEHKDFFVNRPIGVNCLNKFVQINSEGDVVLFDHHPDQKCRMVIPANYVPFTGLPDSVLKKFLGNLPYDDPEQREKHLLFQEMYGVAVTGMATRISQPKAFVFVGRSANNGKSVLLELLEGLVGSENTSHVSADEFGEKNNVVRLRGKTFNWSAELTSATAVSGAAFKKVVTGDPIDGKFLYKDIVDFRSGALNAFATNKLPPFAGGIDPGVRRRLIAVEFENQIPVSDMDETMIHRILANEMDLLLSWAIAGAQRVVRNGGFTIPASCVETLTRWTSDTDAVKAWVADRVRGSKLPVERDPGYKPSDAYALFLGWATENFYDRNKLPKLTEFQDRLAEVFPSCKRRADSRRLKGVTIALADTEEFEPIQPRRSTGCTQPDLPWEESSPLAASDPNRVFKQFCDD